MDGGSGDRGVVWSERDHQRARDGSRSPVVEWAAEGVSDERLISMPVDRAGCDGPRLTGADEMVLSLSANGLTQGVTSAFLARMRGAEATGAVQDPGGVAAAQAVPGEQREHMRAALRGRHSVTGRAP
ncbi:hypothetical protein [Streptomyces tendae]